MAGDTDSITIQHLQETAPWVSNVTTITIFVPLGVKDKWLKIKFRRYWKSWNG